LLLAAAVVEQKAVVAALAVLGLPLVSPLTQIQPT
jgi:hypothetical protein